MDKDTSVSVTPTATIDPKDKLAALREKRRIREAGIARDVASVAATTPNSTPAAAAASTSTTAASSTTAIPLDNTASINAAHPTTAPATKTISAEDIPSKIARKSISMDFDEDSVDSVPEILMDDPTAEIMDSNTSDIVVEDMNAIGTNDTQLNSKFLSSINSKADMPISAAEFHSSNDGNDMARLQHLLFTAQCEIKEKQSLLTESNFQLITALKAVDNEKKEKETHSDELATLKVSFDSLNKQLIDSKEKEKNLTALLSKAKEGGSDCEKSIPIPHITANSREVELETQV